MVKHFAAYANKHQKRVLERRKTQTIILLRASKQSKDQDYISFGCYDTIYREFDPGSG